MIEPHTIPIFARHGDRMVAVNPANVRAVETQTSGGCKIIFDRDHELMVDASLYDVVRSLWGKAGVSGFEQIEVRAS